MWWWVHRGVQAHSKGENTMKNLLVFPKDKEAIMKQSNIIYWFKCSKTECNDEYIGESARTFEEWYKEHLKPPSPIFEHQKTTGHTTTVDNFKIIGREGQNMARTTKGAIYIRGNNPTMNRNIGEYNLPHIGTEFCFHLRTKKKINDLSTTTSVPHEVYQKNNWPLHWNICITSHEVSQ